jgi:putative flippase GtrA
VTPLRFARYNVVSGAGIGVQLTSIWILDRATNLPLLALTTLAVATAVLHNFLWHWRWTWADRQLRAIDVPGSLLRFTLANGAVSLAGNLIVMAALAGGAGLPPVAANLIAIATCGAVNFVLADQVAFRRRTGNSAGPERPAHLRWLGRT